MMNFIISFLLLFISPLVLSQDSNIFQLSEEIILDPTIQGMPIRLENGIGLFDLDNMNLTKYDYQNDRIVESIEFKLPEDLYVPFAQWRFLVQTDFGFILPNDLRSEFLFFDKSGSYIGSENLKLKFNKIKYGLHLHGVNSFNYYYNLETKSIFLNISPIWNGYMNTKKYFEGGIERYSTKGLIGEIDMKGNLLNVYGEYDSIYQNHAFLTYLDACPFSVSGKGEIYYSCQLADNISINSSKEHEVLATSQRGRYFNNVFTSRPTIGSTVEKALYNTSYTILSSFYWDVHLSNQYLIRTYTAGIEDTVSISEKEKIAIEEWYTGKSKSCLLTPLSELKRKKLLGQKPFFIQIYDLNKEGALVYDGELDIKYPVFLKVLNDKFYFFDAKKPATVKVYSLIANTSN